MVSIHVTSDPLIARKANPVKEVSFKTTVSINYFAAVHANFEICCAVLVAYFIRITGKQQAEEGYIRKKSG
jgi:hypothetical protein